MKENIPDQSQTVPSPSMSRVIRFGTDGWRGVIADDFTFPAVERAARALAQVWKEDPAPGAGTVVVGYDRRFLSEHFAAWVAHTLAEEGFRVVLASEPVPTPAVCLTIRKQKAQGGVMITASHNPPWYNGFKMKEQDGGAAGPKLCAKVEARLNQVQLSGKPVRPPISLANVERRSLRPIHQAALIETVDWEVFTQTRLRVAHDAMFGCGAGYFTELLQRVDWSVTPLRQEVDPLFGGGQPEPIPQHYSPTLKRLRQDPHDVCLVNDGDADRIGAIDEQGRPLTAHEVVALLLLRFLTVHRDRVKGCVLKTVNTTTMIDRICRAYGVEVVETPIGFKILSDQIRNRPVFLAVEESGSIAWPEYLPDRDGIAAGFWLLEWIARQRKPLSRLVHELHQAYGPHAYDRIGLKIPADVAEKAIGKLQESPPSHILGRQVQNIVTIDGIKFVLEDESWVMIRRSGTEALLRIYAEAATQETVRHLLQWGQNFVESI